MRKKQEVMRSNEIDLDQDEIDDLDTELALQEKQILSALSAATIADFASKDPPQLYGLPIFWAIV